MDKIEYRENIGQQLKQFRESKKLTVYAVSKKGSIRINQVQAVERGDWNYTVDALIGYMAGCGLCMHFEDEITVS